MSMKNSNDTSRDRARDLPICSTVLYPLYYRGPNHIIIGGEFFGSRSNSAEEEYCAQIGCS